MTPLRRTAALALVLPALALAPAAASQGPLSSTRVATVELALADDYGGVLHLAVLVADGVEADTVAVEARRCDAAGCAHPVHYEGVVDGATAALDGEVAAGQASLALGGRSFALRWEPDPQPGVVMGSTRASGSSTSTVAGTYVAEPARAEVAEAGVTCSEESGAVGDAARVALPEDGHGAALPLASLRLPGGELVCSTNG